MSESRHFGWVAVTAIALAVALVAAAVAFVPQETVAAAQPEYVDGLFDAGKIASIDIRVDESDWASMLANASAEEFIPCDVTVNGVLYRSVGIRPKGNSSLQSIVADPTTDRFSFKIKFNEYVKGQKCMGLTELALNNAMADVSYMKEYLSYGMFASMGIATPAFAYGDISLNGEPWGFYFIVEVMDASFLTRSFGDADGNLYKPESNKLNGQRADGADAGRFQPGAQGAFGALGAIGAPGGFGGSSGKTGTGLAYVDDAPTSYAGIFDNAILSSTTDADKARVVNMIKVLSTGEDLESVLDVDEVLRYFAVNTFLVNLDSYAGNFQHNYYLYEKDGICSILPWDFNLSFAGFRVTSASEAVNFPIDAPVTGVLSDYPLLDKLLAVPAYKDAYHAYLSELIAKWVDSGKFSATVSAVDALIGDHVKEDASAFYTYDQYANALPNLVRFATERAAAVKAQLAGAQPSTSYGDAAATFDLNALGQMGNGGAQPGGDRPIDVQGGLPDGGAMPNGKPQRTPPAGFIPNGGPMPTPPAR